MAQSQSSFPVQNPVLNLKTGLTQMQRTNTNGVMLRWSLELQRYSLTVNRRAGKNTLKLTMVFNMASWEIVCMGIKL